MSNPFEALATAIRAQRDFEPGELSRLDDLMRLEFEVVTARYALDAYLDRLEFELRALVGRS